HPGGARAQKKALRQAVTGRTGERGATVHLGAPGDGGGGDGMAREPALAVRFWAVGLVPTRRAPARACPPAPVASAAGQRGARLLDPGGGTLPPCMLQGGQTSGWWEPSVAQGAPVRGTSPRRRPERLPRAWQPAECVEQGPMLPGAWPLIEPQHGATRRGRSDYRVSPGAAAPALGRPRRHGRRWRAAGPLALCAARAPHAAPRPS